MTFIPYLNLAYLGLITIKLPSFSLTTDLDPRNEKSNQILLPEINPTFKINSPRYPMHIPISY